MIVLQSCVDNNLEFPEDDPIETTESIAIISLLNYLDNQSIDNPQTCFDFIYPLHLGYSSGFSISINNLDGLLEASRGQEITFFVNSLSFPILATFDSQIRSIDNESDFVSILKECSIPTLREDMVESYLQCFDFNFPIEIIENESILEVTKQEDYESLLDQDEDFELAFVFPLSMEVFSKDQDVSASNYFELYQVLNECDGCPALSFEIEQETDLKYKFITDFDDSFRFDWYIDDRLIPTDTPLDILEEEFEPGTYEICIKSTTNECALGVEFCDVLVVEDPCPFLSFEIADSSDPFQYVLSADFPKMDEITYTWKVFDTETDKLEEFELEEPGGDNKFEIELLPGEYEACIFIENDLCDGQEFCKQLIVEEACPSLFFEETRTEENNWKFIAEFEGMNELESYEWRIDGEWVESEGTLNEGDNFLYWDFQEEGTYEVCLFAETTECPSGTEYCEQIFVQFDNQVCAELSFVAERDGDNPSYFFEADFESRDDVTYEWLVFKGDDYQGGEMREATSANDHLFSWQFERGIQYTVCLEQDGNCANRKICKSIFID
ncbi:MAG: hypothetical protein JXR03_02660 [Cyclobacteriaceae bacterium]